MFAVILFFNECRTDYLIFGPFATIDETEDAHRRLLNKFQGAVSSNWVSLAEMEG